MWLHGSGPGATGMSNFGGNLAAFADHRNIVVDLPGWGASPRPETDEPLIFHAVIERPTWSATPTAAPWPPGSPGSAPTSWCVTSTPGAWTAERIGGGPLAIDLSEIDALTVREFNADIPQSACVSAKHGRQGLSKVLALEGAAHGVTSNGVCPGYVRTPLVENQLADQVAVHGLGTGGVLADVLLARSAGQTTDRARRGRRCGGVPVLARNDVRQRGALRA